MYDSRYQGSHEGRQVVYNAGVANAITAVAAKASAMFPARDCANRQTIATKTIESPIVFRMSTRSRSVHGAQGSPNKYSCNRKR